MNTPNRIGWCRALALGLVLGAVATSSYGEEGLEVPSGAAGTASGSSATPKAPLPGAVEALLGDPELDSEAAPIEAPHHVAARNLLQRAWQAPADSLEQRAEVTRRAALEVGAWNLDPAAIALTSAGAGEGSAVTRARAAVRLAPDLPAAHLALARALWLEGEDLMAAVRGVVAGLQAIPRHAEASLWFAGTALHHLAVGLVGGGLLLIALAGIVVASRAAHDIAHMWPAGADAPSFARYAGLAALLLMPLALGEGLLGLMLAVLVLGMLYGTGGRRFALTLAALGLFAGLYPVPWLAGIALDAFPGDPVLRAAHSTTHGVASPVDLARLEHAAPNDSLAVRALAMHARQTGNLARADAFYQRLLAEDGMDLVTINNAANVRLDLGHVDRALELYDRALDLKVSPVVLFNLSQTYGRAFQVDDLNRTLAEAQRVDGPLVADFTSLQRTKNESFVVDMPIPVSRVWWRAFGRKAAGDALAAEFRAPIAPGFLGRSERNFGAVLGLILGFGWLVGARFVPSGACGRCGERLCPRCDATRSLAKTCDSCNRLFYQPEKTEKALRAGRIDALRERERRVEQIKAGLSLIVPGAAGWFAARPVLGYIGTLAFTAALAGFLDWRGVVPDPGVAGLAGPVAFLGVSAAFSMIYLATIAASRSAEQDS